MAYEIWKDMLNGGCYFSQVLFPRSPILSQQDTRVLEEFMQLKTRPQNAKEYCATMISDYLTKERVILFLLDLFTTAQIKLFVVADGAKPNMKSCKTTEA